MNASPTAMDHLQPSTVDPAGSVDLPPVPMSQSPVAKFREYLEICNLKVTGERMRIVEHVFEKHNHFEADQLVGEMKSKNLQASRSTVYRTLTLLVEAGLLRELQFGSRTAYEHDYGYPQHEHLHCEKCGEVIEFVSDELAKLQEEVCRRFHFRPTHHKFIIHGVCERCNAPRTSYRKLDLI